MPTTRDFEMCRREVRQHRASRLLLFFLLAALVQAGDALAHGVDHRIDRGEAVIVTFTSHHDGAIPGAGFRVFSPDGRTIFASGKTDALGRAVFVPDQPGAWRVLMATEDGHGAEVEVPVDEGRARAGGGSEGGLGARATGRIPATAAGIGYLFGLAGLLALWRVRR